MPITKDNFRKYYFGMAAELFIQGEIYAHGYETHKMQPDIGFDLIAQNCALTHFCGATPKYFHIQVKSRLMSKPEVVFYISETDFNLLMADESSALVCVLMYPKVGRSYNPFDYENFRDSSLIVFNQIYEGNVQEELRSDYAMRVGEVEDKYNITAYIKKYFWLGHNHIKRLASENFFFDYESDQNRYKCLHSAYRDGAIWLRDVKGQEFELNFELCSMKNLLIENVACRDDLDSGKLFVMDAF